MKNIILILFLCFTALPVLSYDYAKDGFPALLTNASYGKITQVEHEILGQTYESQNINLRLSRLERVLFNKTYPKLHYDQRINNIIVNYRNGTAFSGLSNLEQKIFGQIYSTDNPDTRISRLESEIMGTIQHGDLLTRYKNLQRVATAYRSNKLSRQYGGMPAIRSGGWRGLAGSFGNFFNTMNGYPTGYTPQIYPQQPIPYGPDYQQNYYSNRGYGYNNTK